MEWTPSAEAELTRHLHGAEPSLAGAGADPAEVAEDIRRHVETEMLDAGVTVVTADDVHRLLQGMGMLHEPPAPPVEAPPPVAAPPMAPTRRSRPKRVADPTPILLMFGVLLPSIAILVELSNRICADNLFDPLPTTGHVLYFASIVVASLALTMVSPTSPPSFRKLTAVLCGFGLSAAIVYSLIFLPIVPISLIAILGLVGFLSLSPFFALYALWKGRRWLGLSGDEGRPRLTTLVWTGVGLGLLFLFAIEAPSLASRSAMKRAIDPDPATRARAIAQLRTWGQEDQVLRACYVGEEQDKTTTLLGNLSSGSGSATTQQAREIYYRVTGRPFNSVPRPVQGPTSSRAFAMTPTSWEEQGGAVVAGRIPGLALAASRLDGSIDGEAALAYLEWTLEFENSTRRNEEARAEIALPPGGTVSRVTLWVDGIEREAVFGERDRIARAYRNLVQMRNRIQRSRDPVLVRTSGPGRILVQCFPVLPNRKRMKIRLGITVPLELDASGRGWVSPPTLVERNFDIPSVTKHSVWWESHAPLEGPSEGLVSEQPEPDVYAVRGMLSDDQLSRGEAGVWVERSRARATAWTPDPTASDAWAITQRIEVRPTRPTSIPQALAIVIDGSRLMDETLDEVARVIEELPAGLLLHVYLAREETPEILASGATTTPVILHQVALRLRDAEARGGSDAVPALVEACRRVAGTPDGTVLWIHGPQPVELHSTGALTQVFDRRPESVRVVALQAVGGPNRVLGSLDLYPGVETLGRRGDPATDIGRLFARWKEPAAEIHIERRRVASSDVEKLEGAKRTSLHLAKLWARDHVDGRVRTSKQADRTSAQVVGARYRVVTPVTAAVVLETDQQYRDANLVPPEPTEEEVPTIPEPETWALMIAVALLLLVALRRKRSRLGRAPA